MATNGVVSRASLRQGPLPARGGGGANSVRSKPAAGQKKSMAAIAALRTSVDFDSDSERVRVAIRLRPKNAEDLASETDFVDCIELQPESKRLKLRKNNWSSETYKFDEVFTESSSQKRVYDTVAKPVVESVLNGCNGTVMAYGQTGTGKTYTVGRLGKEDPSERGIMVRALEDILADSLPGIDTIAVSYLQIYLESIQDLLAPERSNISIAEDPRTGNVSLPGATVVEITELDQFIKLLQIGEANRHAANTKLNTESSRSHAILMVYIQRSSQLKAEASLPATATSNDISCHDVPTLLKSKLLIVDLAGSERIDKSGSEGHMLEEAKFINLSLTSLGKCINALAENSSHIPTRDSKLTRLLRDSFGGTARTSLIITVGPSARHYSETASTIMFGQRAMKVVNNVKVKEELDYESFCRKLQGQVDNLTSEIERQEKLRESEKTKLEKRLKDCEISLAKAEHNLSLKSENFERDNACLESKVKNLMQELDQHKNQNRLMSDEIIHLKAHLKNKNQLENSTYQKVLADTTQMYEKKIVELTKQLEYEQSRSAGLEKELADDKNSLKVQQAIVEELNLKLQSMSKLNEEAGSKIHSLEAANSELMSTKESLDEEVKAVHKKLLGEQRQMKHREDEIVKLKLLVSDQVKNMSKDENLIKPVSGLGQTDIYQLSKPRETLSSQKATTVSKIFEEVGFPNMFAMLRSENLDVQTHAAKVIANLAADDANQERIVEEGGLDALLLLLETSKDTTIHRITAGAIANLAMNGMNQGLIMSKGGARLLSNIAYVTNDPQTLRMVAGAIANLCGNEKLHEMLKDDGAIRALLTMANCGHSEVIAQIARGIANFAKCESRAIREGHKKGRSLLLEEGVLSWLVANSASYSNSTRRHIELALCHLAQNDDNCYDIVLAQGVKQLLHISQESSKEDIRNLAKRALDNPIFSSQLLML